MRIEVSFAASAWLCWYSIRHARTQSTGRRWIPRSGRRLPSKARSIVTAFLAAACM
jgi:hypothetical protein